VKPDAGSRVRRRCWSQRNHVGWNLLREFTTETAVVSFSANGAEVTLERSNVSQMGLQPVARKTVISYVRGRYDAEVIELAKRLISEGVPCDLDLFDSRPSGGWSRWVAAEMTGNRRRARRLQQGVQRPLPST